MEYACCQNCKEFRGYSNTGYFCNIDKQEVGEYYYCKCYKDEEEQIKGGVKMAFYCTECEHGKSGICWGVNGERKGETVSGTDEGSAACYDDIDE